VEHGRHYQLKMAYEHNLQRTAFNFCYGPFGAVKGMQTCFFLNLFSAGPTQIVQDRNLQNSKI
jgi:hypothetical protein